MSQQHRKSRGFTIIELMIATALFSVILLVITTAILQFSKQYYKGIISSTTQGVARTLVDDVTRSILFNGGGVSTLSNGYCVGTAKRYSYALNRQVTEGTPDTAQHQSRHGLVSDSVTSCTTVTPSLAVTGLPADLKSSAITPTLVGPRELLGANMRLAKLDIVGSGTTYTITVRVIYGDDDLLCSPTTAGDCADPNSTAGVNANKADLVCRGSAGSQFCAVSELSTIVRKRVD